MNEFHARFNQFFAQCIIVIFAGVRRLPFLRVSGSSSLLLILCLFVGKLLHFELEDFLNEAGKRVVHLQKGVEVARVTDIAKASRLILVSNSLIDARNWLPVSIHS